MIEFDRELDCSQPDVFQPVVITAYEDAVLIKQWDGAGEDLHCVGIPTKDFEVFLGALMEAYSKPGKNLILDCERKVCHFEENEDEA